MTNNFHLHTKTICLNIKYLSIKYYIMFSFKLMPFALTFSNIPARITINGRLSFAQQNYLFKSEIFKHKLFHNVWFQTHAFCG